MKTIQMICDRCGVRYGVNAPAEYPSGKIEYCGAVVLKKSSRPLPVDEMTSRRDEINYDLCPRCLEDFARWLIITTKRKGGADDAEIR